MENKKRNKRMTEIINNILKVNNYFLAQGINLLAIICSILITQGLKFYVFKIFAGYNEVTKDAINLISCLIISIGFTVMFFIGNWNIAWILKTIALSFACSVGLFSCIKAGIKIIKRGKK
jgi:hypothetical protein